MAVVTLLLHDVTCCYDDYVNFLYYKTNCGLTAVPPDIPAETKKAWVNHNFITEISVGIFSNLNSCVELVMDSNKLTVVKSGMFEGLKSLKLLNLGHNQITHIEPGSFSSLKLDELYLDNNRLTKPMDQQELINSQPISITLGNNPLQCDSRMCWMKQAELDKLIIWNKELSWGEPDCENYPDVHWDDVTLYCPASGKKFMLSTKKKKRTK